MFQLANSESKQIQISEVWIQCKWITKVAIDKISDEHEALKIFEPCGTTFDKIDNDQEASDTSDIEMKILKIWLCSSQLHRRY